MVSLAAKTGEGETMIALVFADDHPVARSGIRTMLKTAPDIQIVGEAENGDQVLYHNRAWFVQESAFSLQPFWDRKLGTTRKLATAHLSFRKQQRVGRKTLIRLFPPILRLFCKIQPTTALPLFSTTLTSPMFSIPVT
jgi:hypothetical protein